MTLPIPRPRKRLKDVDAMRIFHLEMLGEPCEVCEKRTGTLLHHVKYRSRGGDDVRANFLWVCSVCDSDHAALPSISRYDSMGAPGVEPEPVELQSSVLPVTPRALV